ncbi:hypothetical protein MTP99_007750 [Tenebrio molitor]|nr:hypothetical protein MTP99_007750 [Tenebrio molitor]
MRTTTRRVENTVKKDREECILVGGDFNGGIVERGARNWEEENGNGKRKTQDKVENAEGKRMMEWIEENGWEVLNGNEEGEMTYVGSRGETVIDYAIENEAAWERVEEVKKELTTKKREREEQKKVTIKVWDEQGMKEYRRIEEATRSQKGTNHEEKGKGGAEEGNNKSVG